MHWSTLLIQELNVKSHKRAIISILEVLLLVHTKNLLLSCIYTTKVFLTNGFNWSHFNINYWAQLFEGWLALNLASHAGVFRGARFSSLKTPAWEATLNPGSSFLCSKEFSRIISSVIFRAFNHQLVDKKKKLKLKCFLSFQIWIQISH